MNMKKLRDFTKKYGFYLAVGTISIGAITGVYLTSRGDGSESQDLEVYADGAQMKNPEEVDSVLDEVPQEDDLEAQIEEVAETNSEELVEDITEESEESMVEDDVDPMVEEAEEASNELNSEQSDVPLTTNQEEVITDETALLEESMSTAQAPATEEVVVTQEVESLEFTEGDTLLWPVEGAIIVPYTDDTTKHWISTALNQTMRTYGICISADEGTAIQAPAAAKVVEIIEDATSLDWYKRVGDVGQLIILDHGNGYQTQIGVQGGEVDRSLIGQTISAGTQIATVGAATGPFVDMESSVYMQVRHNDDIIDPTAMLDYQVPVVESMTEQ